MEKILSGNEFNNLVNEGQKEIRNVVLDVQTRIAKEAQKIYNTLGLDGFENLHDAEYLGVASMDMIDYDRGTYLFPQGLSDNYEGWVPSSHLD